MHSSRMRTVRCSSYLLWGGVSAQGSAGGGGCLPRGLSAQGGCLPRGMGVSAQRGCLPGVCVYLGVSAQGGGGVWLGGVSTWEWSAQGCVSALGVYPSMH